MKLCKCSALYGRVNAVDSKSDAHRALICAALCSGQTKIKVRALNDDIVATATALEALGASVYRQGDTYTVNGRAVGGGSIFCRESGSTARFLLPVAAALGGSASFSGSGRLPERPMGLLTAELRRHGCEVSADFLPITVSGGLSGGRYVLSGGVSSQFISGLLMALPLTDTASEIMLSSPLESERYADMTVRTLERFGVKWKKLTKEETQDFCGGYRLLGAADYGRICTAHCISEKYDTYTACEEYNVEGDWSGAAFFAVAAALSGEIELSSLDADSYQPDKAVLDVIASAGATVKKNNSSILVRKGQLTPFSVDVSQYPDIFPILAVLACGAKGESLLFGAGRLRIKESDRIETTANMIRALGGSVEVGKDYLRVFGTGRLVGGTVDGAGDHRIVMSAAVASLLCENEVGILGWQAVNKSYPEFFEVFDSVKVRG